MFRSLAKVADRTVQLEIEGQQVSAPVGATLWATMALHGLTRTRTASVSGQQRSAYCAMGVCFECLVEVDGMPNRQACLTQVVEGMVVKRQQITEQSHWPVEAIDNSDDPSLNALAVEVR